MWYWLAQATGEEACVGGFAPRHLTLMSAACEGNIEGTAHEADYSGGMSPVELPEDNTQQMEETQPVADSQGSWKEDMERDADEKSEDERMSHKAEQAAERAQGEWAEEEAKNMERLGEAAQGLPEESDQPPQGDGSKRKERPPQSLIGNNGEPAKKKPTVEAKEQPKAEATTLEPSDTPGRKEEAEESQAP